MAFGRLEFGKRWTSPTDFPTFQDSEEQVRADMQYHPDAVRDYLNNTLLPALEAKAAAATLGAVASDGTASTVQSILSAYARNLVQLTEDIETLAGGGVPVASQCVSIPFTAASWVSSTDGVSLTISKAEHKRNSANYGYNIYHLVGSLYKSGTWATAATRVAYNADGTITLTADSAYSGKIVFFGL